MNLQVHLPRFEGPLPLLLYLIRKEEMNIFDININQITKQYLEFIQRMKDFNLEVAGEFVAMAATLIQIKSQMLLPQYNEHGEVVEDEDPRRFLVQRLLEYQKFQDAAQNLYRRSLLGREVFPRGFVEEQPKGEEIIEVDERGLFSLISAYRSVIKNIRKSVHRVITQGLSIGQRIIEIKDALIVGQKRFFNELLSEKTSRVQILMTFLSLLELGKLGYISLFQNEGEGEIVVETKRSIERDVVSRVEEYEAVNAAQIADQILADSIAENDLDDQNPIEDDSDQMNTAVASDDEILNAEKEIV